MTMQPLWSISYALYTFYLSLYMKSLGVTDRQIGYLISLGYAVGFLVSLFAGLVIDAMGRKKATLVFDLLAWPVMTALYAVSYRFWHFAAAMALGNAALRFVGISWTLTVIEDADTEERVAAFNLSMTINIAMGILTPAAGLLVRRLGIVAGERALLCFASLVMTTMMLIRHRMLKETKIGREILAERRKGFAASGAVAVFYQRTFACLRARPRIKWILMAIVLFNTFNAFGSFSSLYYGLYLTEALRLDTSAISLLGGINAAVLLTILIFLVPTVTSKHRRAAMFYGLGLQAAALGMFIAMPRGRLGWAAFSVVVFAIGFGLFRPFVDSLLAEVTEGKDRAGLYSLMNLAMASLCVVMGVASGWLYHYRPALLYLVSFGILTLSAVLLGFGSRADSPNRQGTSDDLTCEGF